MLILQEFCFLRGAVAVPGRAASAAVRCAPRSSSAAASPANASRSGETCWGAPCTVLLNVTLVHAQLGNVGGAPCTVHLNTTLEHAFSRQNGALFLVDDCALFLVDDCALFLAFEVKDLALFFRRWSLFFSCNLSEIMIAHFWIQCN